jgi:hypothetical protein
MVGNLDLVTCGVGLMAGEEECCEGMWEGGGSVLADQCEG